MNRIAQATPKLNRTIYYHCPVCKQMVENKDKGLVIKGKECEHRFHRQCLTLTPRPQRPKGEVVKEYFGRKKQLKIKAGQIFGDIRKLDQELKQKLETDYT